MENFDVRREGDRATVAPRGDVVATAVADLRQTMRDLVRGGVREMVVDLHSAEMMDSTGIGLLLAGYNSLGQAGGKFSVVGASPEILELLRTMRVHQRFTVEGREPAAGKA
jgi:anti-sigma B factor antagonist